ncbi:MAG: hypothetical protein GKB99_05260 [Methanocellales archaeon]|nr:hypothetical protein [Methanocellales archaeon]
MRRRTHRKNVLRGQVGYSCFKGNLKFESSTETEVIGALQKSTIANLLVEKAIYCGIKNSSYR